MVPRATPAKRSEGFRGGGLLRRADLRVDRARPVEAHLLGLRGLVQLGADGVTSSMHLVQAADCLVRPELRAVALYGSRTHCSTELTRPLDRRRTQLRVWQRARKELPSHCHGGRR